MRLQCLYIIKPWLHGDVFLKNAGFAKDCRGWDRPNFMHKIMNAISSIIIQTALTKPESLT